MRLLPLLQASLRPVLANLAFHYKLDLTVLRALQHLLALLSSWFNVTLGAHGAAMSLSLATKAVCRLRLFVWRCCH